MKQRNYFIAPAMVLYGSICCVALFIVRFIHHQKKTHAVALFIMLFIPFSSFAQAGDKPLQYDTSSITHRHFSESSINKYKDDSDFDYERKMVKPESFLSRFWRWFWNLYDDLTSTPAGRTIKDIFLWALFISALAFFVYKVYKTNRVALFSANPQMKNTYTIGEENIHEINFESAITDAENEGNYRLAVRLYYLKNLKLLTDKELIDWQLNKTNTDYIRELANTNYYEDFQKSTRAFEYAWYGNMPVSKEEYEIIKDQFITFQKSI